MKKGLFLLITILFLGACSDKIERDLNGKWKLIQVEQNGHVENIDTIYYNFLTSLFTYQVYDTEKEIFILCNGFKTMKSNDEILVELTSDGINLDGMSPDQFRAKYTDWDKITHTFFIEKLSNSELILKDEDKRYIFESF